LLPGIGMIVTKLSKGEKIKEIFIFSWIFARFALSLQVDNSQ
jgi:hypothetical protein